MAAGETGTLELQELLAQLVHPGPQLAQLVPRLSHLDVQPVAPVTVRVDLVHQCLGLRV